MQGQLSGFHYLIVFLKLLGDSNSLIFIEINSQILGPKNETVSVPLYIY